MANVLFASLIVLHFIKFSYGENANIKECATAGQTPRPTIPPEYCQDTDPNACAGLFPLNGDQAAMNLQV
ncbi:unnamed protein product [Dracunculus medinensis]|uniref:Secreted protein n=1 Tax=Dracunculus medinensis TaxID=318479 RepID=A0A0N4USC3_DRAME|nr:unnamed protein product [Dracunculus medinensis]